MWSAWSKEVSCLKSLTPSGPLGSYKARNYMASPFEDMCANRHKSLCLLSGNVVIPAQTPSAEGVPALDLYSAGGLCLRCI